MKAPEEYLTLRFRLPGRLEDDLGSLLSGMPILGSEIVPAGDGNLDVCVYLEPGASGVVGVLTGAVEGLGARGVEAGRIQAEDWLRAWREAARPFPVGDLWWLDPRPGDPTPPPPGRVRLAVEPRAAFGSGSHESTQLVLLELEGRDLAGRSVLDVGTGTGILALAAAFRGARPVVGFDVDPLAALEAARTAAEQDRPVECRFFAGTVEALGDREFDLVLVNMIWENMAPLLPELRDRLAAGGELVLSGLLAAQEAAVVRELEELGLRVLGRRSLGEWTGLVAGRA